MMLIKMAWRNLWRRKRRTMITALTVAFGVFMSVTFIAISDYSHSNTINTSAKMGFGHLTVEAKGYNERPSLDKRLRNASEVSKICLNMPDVRRAITRVTGQAMFSTASKSVGGTFIAVDPAQESAETNIYFRSIVKGSIFKDTSGNGVVVGAKMAEKLNLDIGKKLIFTATDIHGEIVSEIFRVSGIFKTGSSEVDGYIIMLPIDRIRNTLHYEAGDATIVSIFIDDHRYAEDIRDILSSIIGNAEREVLTYSETQADTASMISIDRSSHYLFQFLVSLLIAAGVLNTILMSVLERTREFGIMMAVGMPPGRLFRLVMLESVFIGILGIIIGTTVTAPWFVYMSRTGIDISQLLKEITVGGAIIEPVIKFRLYGESAVTILFEMLFLSVAAGLYPAFRAGRIPPVESLKTI